MSKSYLNRQDLPRGLRNNNPGNLVRSSNNWQGKIPFAQSQDDHFEQFYTLNDGIRACAKLLVNKVNSGQNTIRKVLVSYAPEFENDTAGYINYVSGQSGIGPDAEIVLNTATLAALLRAIFEQENGKAVADAGITQDDILQGIGLLPEAILQQIGYQLRKNGPGLAAFFLSFSQYFF